MKVQKVDILMNFLTFLDIQKWEGL